MSQSLYDILTKQYQYLRNREERDLSGIAKTALQWEFEQTRRAALETVRHDPENRTIALELVLERARFAALYKGDKLHQLIARYKEAVLTPPLARAALAWKLIGQKTTNSEEHLDDTIAAFIDVAIPSLLTFTLSPADEARRKRIEKDLTYIEQRAIDAEFDYRHFMQPDDVQALSHERATYGKQFLHDPDRLKTITDDYKKQHPEADDAFNVDIKKFLKKHPMNMIETITPKGQLVPGPSRGKRP